MNNLIATLIGVLFGILSCSWAFSEIECMSLTTNVDGVQSGKWMMGNETLVVEYSESTGSVFKLNRKRFPEKTPFGSVYVMQSVVSRSNDSIYQ